MTRWTRSARLALLVIGSLVTSAAAQPATAPKKQPTQHELAMARAHFQAAEAAKADHDYKTAATEYLLAHDLFPDPEFFFNVGEVYRLAGDEPNALTYYQKYLDLEPNGRGAATARTAVDELRRSIAAQQVAAKRAADDEAKRKAAEDARRKAAEDAARRADDEAKRMAAEGARRKADEDAARRADDEARRKAADDAKRKADQDAARRAADDEARRKQPAASPEVPPAAPVPVVRVWYRDPIALGLLGTGVAAIGVGTGFLLSAQSAVHDAKSATTYQGVLDATDRASQRGTVGSIATAAGIVLVGGGVAWIVLHRDSGEQRTVTGWLLPGGGGLVVHGRF
jgi:tetratricopeptide (TPR) repeat protein